MTNQRKFYLLSICAKQPESGAYVRVMLITGAEGVTLAEAQRSLKWQLDGPYAPSREDFVIGWPVPDLVGVMEYLPTNRRHKVPLIVEPGISACATFADQLKTIWSL